MTKKWRAFAGWMLLYLVVLGSMTALLWRARQSAVAKLGTPQAQSEWQEWQGEAARQSLGEGPVLRRQPRSDEPPELVLLRDYFLASFVGLAGLTTALFLTAATLIRGVARGRRFVVVADPPPSQEPRA